MPLFTLTLEKRLEIAPQVFQLFFTKPDNFKFIPGQYGGFTLINPEERDQGGITRRFSLLSTPDDDFISIVTRYQPSAYKKVLCHLPVGSEIKFAGPTGNFTLHTEITTPAVMIAGGIGIAPFYSMIQYAKRHPSTQPLILFYGNRNPESSAYLPELKTIASTHPNFKLIPVCENHDGTWEGETGYITPTLLKKYIPNTATPIYYICGSPAMVTVIQETLVEMGVEIDKIRVEDFPGY